MATTSDRRARVDWIMARLQKAKDQDKVVDRNKLMALCALDTACSERTITDILHMLANAGKIGKNAREVWIK